MLQRSRLRPLALVLIAPQAERSGEQRIAVAQHQVRPQCVGAPMLLRETVEDPGPLGRGEVIRR